MNNPIDMKEPIPVTRHLIHDKLLKQFMYDMMTLSPKLFIIKQ